MRRVILLAFFLAALIIAANVFAVPVLAAVAVAYALGVVSSLLITYAYFEWQQGHQPAGTGWDLIESTSVNTFNAMLIADTNLRNNLHVFNLTYTYYARWAESLVDQHAGAGGNFSEAWIEPVLDDITNWTWHTVDDYISVVKYTVQSIVQMRDYARQQGINYGDDYGEAAHRKRLDIYKIVFSDGYIDDRYIIIPSNFILDVKCGNNSIYYNKNYLKQYLQGIIDCTPQVVIIPKQGGNEIQLAAVILHEKYYANAVYDIVDGQISTDSVVHLLADSRMLYSRVKQLSQLRWEIVRDNAGAAKTPPPSVLFWDPGQLQRLTPQQRLYAYMAWLHSLNNYNWSEATRYAPSDAAAVNITGGIQLGDGSWWFPLYVPTPCTLHTGSFTLPEDVPSLIIYPNGTYKYIILQNGTTLNITKLPGGRDSLTLAPTTLDKWAALNGLLIPQPTPTAAKSGVDWKKLALIGGAVLGFLLIGIPALSGIGERLERTIAGGGRGRRR